MRVLLYAHTFAAGAAGLLAGLSYHSIPSNFKFLISAADEVRLDIDGIISKDVEKYVSQYTPLMKHGFPSYDTLRVKENFMISYDRRNRVPNWVMEHLTLNKLEEEEEIDKEKEEQISTPVTRSKSDFFEDNTIHSYFRATKADYKWSGYDRGHLAAAANHKNSQRELDDTFVLSNIAPQNRKFNQGIWCALERHVRDLVKQYGSVYVCSGPLYLPRKVSLDELLSHQEEKPKRRKGQKQKYTQTSQGERPKKYVIYEVIGVNDVAVPTHFFKVIVCEAENNKYDMEAYIIPNEPVNSRTPLKSFMVNRSKIERAAGFLLFHQIPSSNFRCINGRETASESLMES